MMAVSGHELSKASVKEIPLLFRLHTAFQGGYLFLLSTLSFSTAAAFIGSNFLSTSTNLRGKMEIALGA